ncbi:hypothetical protein QCA50_008308 [Cerrena zonata]|uniref:Fe2OG dioxygenase domain-containing protein n=1 Tax=Cerrena zonata TaxID=2478898 RepID=A0AAW0GAX4_9APHY
MSAEGLGGYLVPGTDEAYYIPNFVTEKEEEYLIRKICESPRQKWKALPNRRLQIWGGDLTPKGLLIPQALPPFLDTYPDVIARIRATGAFQSSAHGGPNHVILNEYCPGQGIMPHEDGPAYHPVVATLSLASHTVFHYYRYKDDTSTPKDHETGSGRSIDKKPFLTLFLEPRSLVITRSSLYQGHLHGIDDVEDDVFPPAHAVHDAHITPIANVDLLADSRYREAVLHNGNLTRKVRYSLTCRDIERVASRLPFAKR